MPKPENDADASPETMPAEAPEPHPIEAKIDAWFNELIHNSPVARSTEAFNYVQSAVAELKRRLTA